MWASASVETILMKWEALWPGGGQWTRGQFRSQALTLAFTEMTSLNSLEPQYPCPILGNMKCPYHRAVAHGRPWEYRPVEVLEKILMEFNMGSYMCKHFVKCFVNKR